MGFVFRHFDKDKSGRLNHQEFKSCLRSLGYDLPMVEEGEPDPEFESILDTVDPNRYVGWSFLYCKILYQYPVGSWLEGVSQAESCAYFCCGEAMVVFTTIHVKVFLKVRLTFVKKKFTLENDLVLTVPCVKTFTPPRKVKAPPRRVWKCCAQVLTDSSVHRLCFTGRDGHVSLQEYMAFMISRETENVKSSEEIESAFRALSSEGKPYVTKEELYQVSTGCGAPGRNRRRLFVYR